MADTIAPIMDLQNKQDDFNKIKLEKAPEQSANKQKGLDLTEDAKQEKKDEKQFKKSQGSDEKQSKGSKQTSKGDWKDDKASKQTKSEKSGSAKGGFKEEGSNTYQQLSDDARESAVEAGEWMKEKGTDLLEATKDTAQTVVEKGKEWLGMDDSAQKPSNDDSSRQPGEFKQETGEWFNEKYNQVVEKTKDVAQIAIDKGKEWLGETTPTDKDEKSNKDSKQETGEWLKEKGNEVVEKTKETAKATLDKGQELLDESNKSSGKKKEKKSGEGKKKEAVNLGPIMFKDNTSVIEAPSDNQRSMKENTKELPSIRTAANVGKGRETPQERLQTGKGQFKHDKQASKQDREQIASTIVTNIHEFSGEGTDINHQNEEATFTKGDSHKESTKKDENSSSKHEESSEKSHKDEKDTKKNDDDIPRGSISKKRGNLEESGEWKELLNESDRTFSTGGDKSNEKETPNTEDHLQSFISDLEKSQQEYSEERKKHLEMAQDPELSAFERIKAAGLALADGAMELTEAGRKKIAEFYASPHTTVDDDEFKGGEKKDESS